MQVKTTKLKLKIERIHSVLLGLSTLALVATDVRSSVNANPVSTALTSSPSISSIPSKEIAPSPLTSPSQTSQTEIAQAIPIKKLKLLAAQFLMRLNSNPSPNPSKVNQLPKNN
jgi:hypothetical protein